MLDLVSDCPGLSQEDEWDRQPGKWIYNGTISFINSALSPFGHFRGEIN